MLMLMLRVKKPRSLPLANNLRSDPVVPNPCIVSSSGGTLYADGPP
jgi:hypothetical protein